MKSRSRGLQRIERLLWATALLTLGIYAGARAVSVLGQSYGEWSFARSAGGQQVSATLFVRYLLGEPEAQPAPPDLPQRAPGLQPLPATSWMARLEIPLLSLADFHHARPVDEGGATLSDNARQKASYRSISSSSTTAMRSPCFARCFSSHSA